MIEFLEKLRQKPDKTKTWYAFLGATIFSSIILGVWLTVVMPNFSFQQSQLSAAAAKEPSPFETLKETFSTGAAAIGSQADQLKASANTISQNLQQYAQYASTTDASAPGPTSSTSEIDATTTDFTSVNSTE